MGSKPVSESESEYDSDTSSDVPDWPEELPPPPPRIAEPPPTRKSTKTLLDAVTCRKAPLYDNCKLLGKDGALMAMISRKRRDWYLKKGIAEVVDESSIRILFTPKGPGGSEYGITEKANCCVVCGRTEKLFRTYIVPHAYRSEFPSRLSMSQSHDVVLQCDICFPKWAKASGVLRNQLAKEFGAPVNGIVVVESQGTEPANDPPNTAPISESNGIDSLSINSRNELDQKGKGKEVEAKDTDSITSGATTGTGSLNSAKSAAKALLKVGVSIPSDRKASLLDRVSQFLGKDVDAITTEELEQLANTPIHQLAGKDRVVLTHERIVVNAFKGREQELAERWRAMFLEECKPKHLPSFWRVGFVKEEWM
ncbi:hypothetical protein BCR33DRAFT_713369 [Rhizoclosmatium globosum]|uniref:Uncharacterized protein n=1 Tax=Rhizoclosmatium globosum TaxID=329046 RepID=A0A1Y2CS82_9FUNG|nr:hypothetical protein BCR33DRAFT_713369 [Rhizoclosmatium globosum]|eukprot:ORY49756.1 hypothetical protein BCR33DRAFT_713369 [Rhizoclosmatium globosum]